VKSLHKLSSLFQLKQESVIRSLNTEVKIFWLVSVVILSLSIQSIPCLFLLFSSTFAYSFLAKAIRTHLLVARRMLFFALLSLLLILTVIRDAEFLMGTLIQIVSKLFVMSSAGILFALTTSPNDLLRLLDRLHVSKIFTFSLTIAMRFVPTLIKEVQEIVDSLKLRGLETKLQNLLRHPKIFYRSIFIPLIVRSIAISDELAAAAETRGFGNPARRTNLHNTKPTRWDFIFFSAVTLFSLVMAFLDYRLRGTL